MKRFKQQLGSTITLQESTPMVSQQEAISIEMSHVSQA